MTFRATNTADHILVVEGQTNLPAGSPLKAEIRTRDGLVLLRDSAVVSHDKFFFDFDLDSLQGLSLYQVVVRFDPQTAPLGVRQVTGLWGESLEGPGVKTVDRHRIYERKLEVLLTADSEGEDWEGRDFSSMEPSERNRIVVQLEEQIEKKPDDRNAKLALARAYIAGDPRELASGTRAYALLKEVVSSNDGDHTGTQALKLTAGIEAKERKTQEAAEQREKTARGDKFKTEKTIWPGKAVGAFQLGSSYRILARHLKLDRPPDFSGGDGKVRVRPKNFPGLELHFDRTSRRIVAIRTTSKRFLLPEKLGVGSLLQELQQAYGREAVPTPNFRFEGNRPDGRAIYRGTSTASGLEFEILREVDPTFGLPLDKVEAVTVFLPSEEPVPVDPAPESEAESAPTPTSSPSPEGASATPGEP